jgi:hypothetical protein
MPVYNVSRIGSVDNGYASEVSLAVIPDGTSAATATRNQNGYVELTLWNLLPGGAIQQAGQISADPQAGIKIAGIATEEYVTTGQSTHGGHIKSIFWRGPDNLGEGSAAQGQTASVVAFPIHFVLIPQTPPPPPGKPTQVAYPQGYLVATAHSTNTHHLRVTSWLAADVINQGIGTLAAANGGRAVATSIAAKRTYLTNANLSSADVVTGTIDLGVLHLGAWRLHVEAMQPWSVEHLHGVVTSVEAQEVAIATYPRDPASTLVTAVVTPDGNLQIIGWQMHDDGTFTQWLTATSETASLVSCSWCTQSIVVTAFRDEAGKLKLIYWQFPASASDPQTINQIAHISASEPLPTGGVSVGHWRANQTPANDLGETLVGICAPSGNARVIRFHLTSS